MSEFFKRISKAAPENEKPVGKIRHEGEVTEKVIQAATGSHPVIDPAPAATAAVKTVKSTKKMVSLAIAGLIAIGVAAFVFLKVVDSTDKADAKAAAEAAAAEKKAREELAAVANAPGTGENFGPVASARAPDFVVETPVDRYSLAAANDIAKDISNFVAEIPGDERGNCNSVEAGTMQTMCTEEGPKQFFKCTHNTGRRWDVTVSGCAK